MADTEKMGVWSKVEPVNLQVIKICLEMKESIMHKINKHGHVYVPVLFAVKSLCGGTDYVVKVYVGDDQCVHAMIHHKVEKHPITSVTKVEFPKTFADPLKPF